MAAAPSKRTGLENPTEKKGDCEQSMTNWKTAFHKPLTRPGVKRDEEMSICSSTPQAHRGYINSSLLESDLKMSESHANVVSFDENVSTLSNLSERNEHLLMNETTVENMTTIGTVYESMMRNQRTYLANQDNKHRLEDECTDFRPFQLKY